MREKCLILSMFTWDVWPLSQQVYKCISLSMPEVKMGYSATQAFWFQWDYSVENNPFPSTKPLTVVNVSLPPSPSLLPPSCSSSSSLPRVCGCFRAWQEAQIRGLKLNQIFSRYRFLRVPGFPTSSTQLLSIPPLNPSLLLSSLQSQAKLCAAHKHTHTRTGSHARMHMGNHKLTQSGGEVQLI